MSMNYVEQCEQKLQNNSRIKSWKQFSRKVRSQNYEFLKKLDCFPNSVLVTGCQRSGTTILARIITNSEGMVNYWFGTDDELDAALILSGFVNYKKQDGRYCFQTTYLNERYFEYFNHENFKIIWVLRNPFSVVYSLMYNWKRFALNELFIGCGLPLLEETKKQRYEIFGTLGISKITKACLSYNGKLSQVFELEKYFDKEHILYVDYDELTENKETILPMVYEFINLEYRKEYSKQLHNKSINKAKLLSKYEHMTIEKMCMPLYIEANKLMV